AGGRAEQGLDLLFEALADEMLTILERAGPARCAHLALAQRLEPGAPATIFERSTRYPDFLAQLRRALRDGIVDVAFYGRALRSIDLREAAIEQRIASQLLASLDPVTLAKLERTGAGHHLGAYNWLSLAPRQAAMRAHVLTNLPAFATLFAEALVPIDLLRAEACEVEEGFGGDPSHEYRDRAVHAASAGGSAIPAILVRRICRARPGALGQPVGWQLGEILRALDASAGPADTREWEALIARAIRAAAL